MRSSSKARYAVAAITDLAARQANRPTALADIAKRLNISVSYLEQLFARLRQQGLIKSARGPGGGYALAKPPAEISIASICEAVTEHEKEPVCGRLDAMNEAKTKTENLWRALENIQTRFLKDVTVNDVLLGNIADAKLDKHVHAAE